MDNNLNKRYNQIYFFVMFLCILLCMRVVYLNVIKGEQYYKVGENRIYKNIEIKAPRGEIRDRNGILLAGNRPVFTVQITKNEIKKQDKLNEVALKLTDILKENNEFIEDSFPIDIEDGNYTYTFDEDIARWKENFGIPKEKNAKESFYYLVEKINENGKLFIDPKMEPYKIQEKLNANAYYPPISIKGNMDFTRDLDKKQWLGGYDIKVDENLSAKEAFARIRKATKIDPMLSDEKARQILVVTDAIKSKRYLQYEPVLIARDISKKTVSILQERKVELKGVDIQVEPLRYYPQGDLCSHVIGQIGRISQDEFNQLKDKGYLASDFIGKAGVEGAYEKELKGERGYERVQVDASGKRIKVIESKEPVAGNQIFVTIDAKLQKVAQDALEKTLYNLRIGGTYKSKWGDKNFGAGVIHPKAKSGATVVLDIETGEVLALASYPGYDPNMFANGLTEQQLKSLQSENPNDPMSPKPQLNLATMTAVQPGSVFKMIPALTALEEGISPYYEIEDKGVIELGDKKFGNWLWNQSRRTQGYQNVISALKNSNNYYFYCVSVGFNYATGKPIPGLEHVSVNNLLDMAKKFGLDKKTGIEIYEIAGSVPNPESRYNETKQALEYMLPEKMKNSFKDINDENPLFEKRINTIISWIDENPSRPEIMERLKKLKVKKTDIDSIADFVKYDYFNNAKWTTGDIFNLSIGQGLNQYTPLQICNYISSIANGGYLNKVSLLDKIVSTATGEKTLGKRSRTKIPLKNPDNLRYIRQGMYDVSDEGTAKAVFQNFPVKVAAKTGTAEKSGKIPTKDEVAYYLNHCPDYYVDRSEVIKLSQEIKAKSKVKYKEEEYIVKAILSLNPKLNRDKLDRFKDSYDSFSWFVAYAPYEKPKIAVVTMLFQGGSGGNAGPATRDVIAQYMGLNDEVKLLDERDMMKIKVEQDKDHANQEITYEVPTAIDISPRQEEISTPIENKKPKVKHEEEYQNNEEQQHIDQDIEHTQENPSEGVIPESIFKEPVHQDTEQGQEQVPEPSEPKPQPQQPPAEPKVAPVEEPKAPSPPAEAQQSQDDSA